MYFITITAFDCSGLIRQPFFNYLPIKKSAGEGAAELRGGQMSVCTIKRERSALMRSRALRRAG